MNLLLTMLAIVTTSLGRIQGVHRATGDAYLGIPYAQPPVGELQFCAPVPVVAWDTVLDATCGKSNCVQESSPYSATHQSRDCLYLNVYVPKHRSSEVLPVLVWYHGGSFATGGIGADTDSTLRQDMGVFADRMHAIVVTVNYRLNVFGYLYLTPLSYQFDTNCGLRDQLLALQWVNQHIAAFGGNKRNITLIGQSAGAASVMAIMAVPMASKWFQRVILMSPPMDSFVDREEAKERTRIYLKLVDVDPDSEHFEQDMRALSDEKIAKANRHFLIRVAMQGDLRCAFSPVIDGQLLNQAPAQAALKCRKPMIIGYVSHEAELFGANIPKSVLPFMAKLMRVDVPEKQEQHKDPFSDRFFETLSKHMFFAPIDAFYQAYAGPKKKYLYDYVTPQMQANGLHCAHSYDMPVIFGWNTPLCDSNDPQTNAVGLSYCDAWKNFIRGKK